MKKPKSIIVKMENEAALVCLAEPVKCGCGVMAMFVVNRGGKTRCLTCDDKEVRCGK